MSGGQERVFHAGADSGVRAALETALHCEIHDGLPGDPRAGDLVVCESTSHLGGAPGNNAFSTCRALKENPRVAVYVVLSPADRFGAEIARFCMADGCLVWHPPDRLEGVEFLKRGVGAMRPRVSVEALLARLEQEMAADEVRRVSAVQRLLNREEEDSLLLRLQDRETGLFNAPYASLKLDEEFKRAVRFHQPLSLVLADIGVQLEAVPEGEVRRTFLAEVASVFLNECRDIDILARFTETTFLVLLPGTGLDGGGMLARRLLDRLRTRDYTGMSTPPRPCAGLATVPATGINDRRGFLIVAEACLRRAQSGLGDAGLCTSWE